ncbi:Uncharacterized protein HZ326_22204 [Fusarium oxysporum f. sp. albedinis]|nr:Uncharacterized protein HZ326_22204 [Fusarium oxysporum f. sp. albedinis]
MKGPTTWKGAIFSGSPPRIDRYPEDALIVFGSTASPYPGVHNVISSHDRQTRTLPPDEPIYHDVIKRENQGPTESGFRTRLRRTDKFPMRCIASEDETAEAFLHWFQYLDLLPLVLYSDGPLSSEEAASYGFIIHQNNLLVFNGSGRLGTAAVFDAEVTGELKGLKAALNLEK